MRAQNAGVILKGCVRQIDPERQPLGQRGRNAFVRFNPIIERDHQKLCLPAQRSAIALNHNFAGIDHRRQPARHRIGQSLRHRHDYDTAIRLNQQTCARNCAAQGQR